MSKWQKHWLKVLCAFLILATALGFGIWVAGEKPSPPSLGPGSPASLSGLGVITYPLSLRPAFPGNCTWVNTRVKTNAARVWLCNVQEGVVLGELKNAKPISFDGTGEALLCKQPATVPSAKRRLYNFIQRLTGRSFGPAEVEEEFYWILNVKNKRAKLVARLPKSMKPAGPVALSPNGNLGYTLHNLKKSEYLLWDMSSGDLKILPLPGAPQGWWSEDKILCHSRGVGFSIYDVDSALEELLLSEEALDLFLREHDLSLKREEVIALNRWSGDRYDFYLVDQNHRREGKKGPLIYLGRKEQGGCMLRTESEQFQFEWNGTFDETGRFYVYSGRIPNQDNSAVFVRDLETGAHHNIAPAQAAEFSAPSVFKDRVIFVRQNQLWKSDFGGTQLSLLFPPSGQAVLP